jgi:hypothetical protein
MKCVPLIAGTVLLDFTTHGFQLFIAGSGVVALFALGAGQSDNISWHGFILLDMKRATGRNVCPIPIVRQVI